MFCMQYSEMFIILLFNFISIIVVSFTYEAQYNINSTN